MFHRGCDGLLRFSGGRGSRRQLRWRYQKRAAGTEGMRVRLQLSFFPAGCVTMRADPMPGSRAGCRGEVRSVRTGGRSFRERVQLPLSVGFFGAVADASPKSACPPSDLATAALSRVGSARAIASRMTRRSAPRTTGGGGGSEGVPGLLGPDSPPIRRTPCQVRASMRKLARTPGAIGTENVSISIRESLKPQWPIPMDQFVPDPALTPVRFGLWSRPRGRGGRAAEGARLERVYTVSPYRGFESHPLRHRRK